MLGLELSRYRLLLIAVGIAVTLALVFGLERRASARASSGGPSTHRRSDGHPCRPVFQLTLAIGCGLAGLGGALGVNVLGLDPYFPLKTLVYFLLVVVVGGAGSVLARCSPPPCCSEADTAGKYYLPKPARSSSTRPWWCCSCCSRTGCWAQEARMMLPPRAGPPAGCAPHVLHLRQRERWSAAEVGFWIALVAVYFLFPKNLLFASQILIAGLFALSLDLVLGYAGIVTLGLPRSSGSAPTPPACWRSTACGIPSSASRLRRTGAVAGWITSFLVLRGRDLARLMITLGIGLLLYEAANRDAITGGVDGLQGVEIAPILGLFAFDLRGRTAYAYVLAVVFVLFLLVRALMVSPYGLTLGASARTQAGPGHRRADPARA